METNSWLLLLVCSFLGLKELLAVNAQTNAYLVYPKEINVLHGETAILPCVVDPTRNAFVIWRRVSPKIDISLGVMIDDQLDPELRERIAVVANKTTGEYNLHISQTEISDEGSYECNVVYGLESSGSSLNTIRLNVLVPPEEGYPLCDVHPAIPLQQGKMVTMSCVTKGGHPPSKVVWYRNHDPITNTTENEQSVQWRLSELDYGVQFTCTETSPALAGVRECSLVPLPFRLSVDLSPAVAEIDVGQEASFTCLGKTPIQANLTFTWHVDNQEIPANSRWIISGDQGQTISLSNAIQLDNQTSVACTVTAGPGQTVKTFAMLVVTEDLAERTHLETDTRTSNRWNSRTTNHPSLNSDRKPENEKPASNAISKKFVIIISLGAVILGVVLGASIAIASIYRSRKVATTHSKPKSFKSSFKTGSTKLMSKHSRGFGSRGEKLLRDSRRITFNDTQITFADPVFDYDDPPVESMSTDPDDSYLGLCPDSLSSSKYEDLHAHVMTSLSFDRFYNEAPAVPEMEYEDVITDRNWSTRSYPIERNMRGELNDTVYLNRTSVA
ncbi:uncharacterized protein [Diadema antillarum]|uniref:uncharacterized protein n=1 Tax=Diadema antillarum TaxID=105358 RepID=UPI003A8A7F42